MPRESIDECEQLAPRAILRLGSDTYEIPILEEIRARANLMALRPVFYVALRRLEEKRMVKSRMADPDPKRGGRARKYYEVLPNGLAVLWESHTALLRMWDGLEQRFEKS